MTFLLARAQKKEGKSMLCLLTEQKLTSGQGREKKLAGVGADMEKRKEAAPLVLRQ